MYPMRSGSQNSAAVTASSSAPVNLSSKIRHELAKPFPQVSRWEIEDLLDERDSLEARLELAQRELLRAGR